MARSNRGGVFGLIRGSVGPATYSIGKTTNGKKLQIVREKPTEIANPRTRAQALQRMKLKPIFFAQQLMRDIVDHSFQGVENGQPSLRHFLSLAMKENDIPYLNKGAIDTAIGGYVIADGDLGDAYTRIRKNGDEYNEPWNGRNMPITNLQLMFGSMSEFTEFDSSFDGSYSAAWRQILSFGYSNLVEGQELAIFTFVHRVVGTSHAIDMRKIRCLVNTSYRTETDSAYIFQKGSGDAALQIPSNTCQALCEYNPQYATDIIELCKSILANISVPSAGTDAEKILKVQSELTARLLIAVLGIASGYSNGTSISGQGIFGWNGVTDASEISAALNTPISISEANVDGSVAAVAVVVSEKVNGNWHFTKSDICLTQGYRFLVNSDVRFENAIASYMAEEGSSSTTSDKFLHLEEYGYDLRQTAFTIRYRQNGAGNILTETVIGGANTNPDEYDVLFTITSGGNTFLCSPGAAVTYPIQVDWLVSDDFLLVDYSEVSF